MRLAVVALCVLSACTTEEPAPFTPAIGSAEDAQSTAEGIVGGTASGGEQVSEDGYDLWEVTVAMQNGATLEVLMFADDGALFEVKDPGGPWDYTLDPLPGQLTYKEAQVIAFNEVAGEQELWEVKFDDGRYFYEFYIVQVGDQLWEVKLWADDGEVFVVEAKNEVD